MSRRRKGLSDEDRQLWDRVAKSATPMHPKRSRSTPKTPFTKPAKADPPAAAPIPAFEISGRARSQTRIDLAPDPAERLKAGAPRMDAGLHKKMSRGKLVPEARIDLHGMTLAEAHPSLIRFVQAAHASGKRLVLVITGKGSGRSGDGPIPTRPGILRRQVPHWLEQPPLRTAVQEIRPAHQRHGGSGAYYVYLRRAR